MRGVRACLHRRLLRCPLTAALGAGAFPTHSLRNLQRLYGLLPGINVAVKVPPRGVKKPIRVLGVFGDTIARMTRKARARGLRGVCRRRTDGKHPAHGCRTFPCAAAASSTCWTTSCCRTSFRRSSLTILSQRTV